MPAYSAPSLISISEVKQLEESIVATFVKLTNREEHIQYMVLQYV